MTSRPNPDDMDDDLAEARAEIEALQAAAADAEARAATACDDLAEARGHAAEVEEQLALAAAERETARGELAETREALTAARTAVREAAARYRAAVLAAAPDIPQDLVPEAEDIAEIDRCVESARRVVGRVREKLEEATAEAARTLRVPAGAPARRAPDVSSLSPEDKIRLGLQQAAQREGH
jgi:septal ring factor EnvC (AmiA/AmiB activator)